jgi:hypothetical protein
LLEAGHRGEEVRQVLLTGAEALEFLSSNPRYDSATRIEQAVNATFGYYLAGHYARSYVLLREAIPEATALPPALGLLVAVLRKQLGASRALTLRHLSDPWLSDDAIAGALEAGEIGEEEAYNRILLRAASEAVSYFLEFPKNGERPLLDEAMRILDDALLIARENRFVDWWWWLFCLRFLFQEFGEASPWTQLPPFRDAGDGSVIVDEYIRSGLRQEPPVMELWPSQAKAVPVITDAARPAFCLKMPTSSGKTRVAELTTLRFLLDHRLDPDAKCIYLAPFRSLAVEVEQSLRRSFGSLGVVVSQIYGGFELAPADLISLDQYRILIATRRSSTPCCGPCQNSRRRFDWRSSMRGTSWTSPTAACASNSLSTASGACCPTPAVGSSSSPRCSPTPGTSPSGSPDPRRASSSRPGGPRGSCLGG